MQAAREALADLVANCLVAIRPHGVIGTLTFVMLAIVACLIVGTVLTAIFMASGTPLL